MNGKIPGASHQRPPGSGVLTYHPRRTSEGAHSPRTGPTVPRRRLQTGFLWPMVSGWAPLPELFPRVLVRYILQIERNMVKYWSMDWSDPTNAYGLLLTVDSHKHASLDSLPLPLASQPCFISLISEKRKRAVIVLFCANIRISCIRR